MSAAEQQPGPTAKQLSLLQVARRKLALAEDDYRAMLENIGGVASARELNAAGFEAVLNHLKKLGFQPTGKPSAFGNRPGMATPGQIELIRRLWLGFYQGPAEEADKALNAWLSRFHHVSALRFVTVATAGRIIPGLRQMADRAAKGRDSERS